MPWFNGERSLADQMIGLDRALEECPGKAVLDLGCAEGLIGQAFADRGASVTGVEANEEVVEAGLKVSPGVDFWKMDAVRFMKRMKGMRQWDIILALSIVHKFKSPEEGLNLICDLDPELVLFRGPGDMKEGTFFSKFSKESTHAPTVFGGRGYVLEAEFMGVKGESVQYWRKNEPLA